MRKPSSHICILKGNYFISLLTLAACLNWGNGFGQTRCIATESRIASGSDFFLNKENKVDLHAVGFRSVVTIPVVMHVLWNKPEENISDVQILSQIESLNKDFSAENIEVPSIPAIFQPLIADAEIEFCLAKVDPDGNPTTGITRKFTNNTVGIGGTSSIHFSDQGGQDAWDTEAYLNIWVAKFSGNIGGTGSFPSQQPSAEDGVEINYLQFGTVNVEPPYHLGRTLTHEIGHYLNLEHPWGPSITDCCEDDFVADTPEACETYLGACPTHPVISCSGPDMFMNFMFYSDDACLSMFTLGQKVRMLETLAVFRSGLLTSNACNPVSTEDAIIEVGIKVYPNPTSELIRVELSDSSNQPFRIELFDVSGSLVIPAISTNRSLDIDLSTIGKGMYFMKISTADDSRIEKVIRL